MKIFVSGTYDILHGGHIQFFEDAKKLGDYLIVSFASDRVIREYKSRIPALSEQHRRKLLESIKVIDKVVMGDCIDDPIFDFEYEFDRSKPDILVSTEDDVNANLKKLFCKAKGAKYVQIPKRQTIKKLSTTDIRLKILDREQVPLRVDFAGGWLDVPRFSIPGAYIVNCTITPMVSLKDWHYKIGSGLGGSAAHAILNGKDPFFSEYNLGIGWQDPAVILETGFCVWRSGKVPVLEMKQNPDFLQGKMALLWTGKTHSNKDNVNKPRNYNAIREAGELCTKDLCMGVRASYVLQILEGMSELPDFNEESKKYCGGGWGGYALYLFKNESERANFLENPNTMAIEPYIK